MTIPRSFTVDTPFNLSSEIAATSAHGVAENGMPIATEASAKYGNKAATLSWLSEFFADSPHIEVPPLLSLSHDSIRTHLITHYLEYEADLIALGDSISSDGRLLERGLALAAYIHERIRGAFQGMDTLFYDPGLTRFLADHHGETLAVRSTAGEDGGNSSMAGVFESFNGVPATQEAVSHYIGEVVVSYHSAEALQHQRQETDMLSLENLFMPVFCQVMKGEKDPLAPLVCGTMHAPETLAFTPGTAEINAALGHNEGVMDSESTIDHAVIDVESGAQLPTVRLKKTRLTVSGAGTFARVENGPDLERKALIDRHLLGLLKDALARLRTACGDLPLDIEWGYEQETDTLWIFQVRPIVERPQERASYLDMRAIAELTGTRRIDCLPLVTQGNRTIVINDTKQMLFGETLQSAWNVFSALYPEEQNQICAIFVSHEGGSGSHFATLFRERSASVFTTNSDSLSRVNLDSHTLVVDTQSASALLLDREQAGDPSIYIREGVIAHPVPPRCSFPPREPTERERVYRENIPLGTRPDQYFRSFSSRLLLEASLRERDAILDDFLSSFLSTIEALEIHPLKQRAQSLFCYALDFSNMIRGEASLTRVALAARGLEAVVRQSTTGKTLYGDSMERILQVEALIAQYCPAPSHDLQEELVSLVEFCCPILSESVQEIWIAFVHTLLSLKRPDITETLHPLLRSVRSLASRELWLTQYFTHVYDSNHEDPWDTLESLLAANESALNASLETHQLSDIVEEMRRLTPHWSRSEEFDSLFKRLTSTWHPIACAVHKQLQAIDHEQILSRLEKTTALIDYIQAYDSALKQLRGTPNYPDIEKRFHLLFTPFAKLALDIMDTVSEDEIRQWFTLDHDEYVPDLSRATAIVKKYCISLRINLRLLTQDEELSPPKSSFNVIPFLLTTGNITVLREHMESPNFFMASFCTEELFTTLHQNSVTILSRRLSSLVKPDLFPSPLAALFSSFVSPVIERNYVATLSNYTIDNASSTHTVSLSVPCRRHSAQFTLVYDGGDNVHLTGLFIGHNGKMRMSRLESFLPPLLETMGFNAPSVTPHKSPISFRSGTFQFSFAIPVSRIRRGEDLRLPKLIDTLLLLLNDWRSEFRGFNRSFNKDKNNILSNPICEITPARAEKYLLATYKVFFNNSNWVGAAEWLTGIDQALIPLVLPVIIGNWDSVESKNDVSLLILDIAYPGLYKLPQDFCLLILDQVIRGSMEGTSRYCISSDMKQNIMQHEDLKAIFLERGTFHAVNFFESALPITPASPDLPTYLRDFGYIIKTVLISIANSAEWYQSKDFWAILKGLSSLLDVKTDQTSRIRLWDMRILCIQIYREKSSFLPITDLLNDDNPLESTLCFTEITDALFRNSHSSLIDSDLSLFPTDLPSPTEESC